jgi:hypothetical protein
VYSGNGVHVDIVVAAAEAYLSALNRLFHARIAASGGEMHKRPALNQREAFVRSG